VTSFTVGVIILRVCIITTFPSVYFSGQEWRKDRKLVSPAFSSSTLDVYFDVFTDNAEILVQTFKTKVGVGEFDVCPYVKLYALDSIIGEYINLLKTKRRLLYLKTQSVPRTEHFSSRL
jgi:cytochrome P450